MKNLVLWLGSEAWLNILILVKHLNPLNYSPQIKPLSEITCFPISAFNFTAYVHMNQKINQKKSTSDSQMLPLLIFGKNVSFFPKIVLFYDISG